jgi:hypothetical protein
MYIDSSRIRTMARIQYELNTPSVPMATKRKAFRLKQKLQSEMKDPILAKLREQLTKAVNANDKYETWKLTCQIKDHLNEEIPIDIYER